MNKDALKNFGQFSMGTENYYRHSLVPNFLFTDGVKYLAENAECFWLIDIIASYQAMAKKDEALQAMQFWHL